MDCDCVKSGSTLSADPAALFQPCQVYWSAAGTVNIQAGSRSSPLRIAQVVDERAEGARRLPPDTTIPAATEIFYDNITIAGGPAPVRAYIEELMPDVMEGRIRPGRVFDLVTTLNGVPEGFRAMNERTAIKVLIEVQ